MLQLMYLATPIIFCCTNGLVRLPDETANDAIG